MPAAHKNTVRGEPERVGANLGFVGLGVMGGRIARRLVAAGHRVTGYNRTKAKAQWLLDAGMRWADSPRAVAQATDVVFTMLTDTPALQAVARGPDGVLAGLAPGKIYVDMSTVSPAASRDLAGEAAGRGAQMMDAPVSGSVSTLEEGRLSIMVGGDRSAFERVKPILLDIGPTVTYVGGNGQAVLMKIATNLSLAVHMLAFSEGVALAEKGGIARETAVAVLLGSVVASPMLKYRGPFVLRMPGEAWFDVTMMQKDLGLALELGRQMSVPLPTTAVTNEWLSAARSMGLGRLDFAALFEVVTYLAGLNKQPIQDPGSRIKDPETEGRVQRSSP
jgi:3-hydroxyisobutyrate dehydrogenase-like beta-hydroxyacid dehydrogenase